MAFPRAACVVVMMALASAVANAEEHTIVIHHMELQHVEGTMRVGDTITFDNQSDMAHNLYITYEDGSVDNTDTQVPGTQRKVTLRKAGPAMIRCWIHPIIKAELDIQDKAEPDKP
jgi:plastocyanin